MEALCSYWGHYAAQTMPYGIEATVGLTFSHDSDVAAVRAAATSKQCAHSFDIRPWRAKGNDHSLR
jgi:hypothetical protein